MSGRKTVLIVDDDPGTLYVLANGLSTVLAIFDVVTAANGREAIQVLEERQVDVLVTDLAMPVMDGFALIAYVTNRRSTLPVVVLSGMAPHSMDQRLAGYGGLRVLRKPAGYQEVAQCVLEEIERVDMGQVEGIPLASVLQLVEAERRSCSVVVTSGKRRGRLQFESGRLVNAFSDDFGAEGEAAAYDILSWSDTAIEFEYLPNNLRKLIYTPMQLMLIELAVMQDSVREHRDGAQADDAVLETGPDAGEGDAVLATSPDARGDAPSLPARPEAGADDAAPATSPDAGADDAAPATIPDPGGATAAAAAPEAGGPPRPVLPAAVATAAAAAPAGAPEGAPPAAATAAGAESPRVVATAAIHAPPAAPAHRDDASHAATRTGPSADRGEGDDATAPRLPDRPSASGGWASLAVPPRGAVGSAADGSRLPPHVRIRAAPHLQPSTLDTRADAPHDAAAGGTEATKLVRTGNGEAMQPDATDRELMRTPPEPARPVPTSQTPPGQIGAAPLGEDREAAKEPAPVVSGSPLPTLVSTPAVAHVRADDHVADMVAAVERLARRAREADEALAAVAAEVDAFRAAQRRFDEINARREQRRRELEAFRDDVARLAREILGRVDGMFDAMATADGANERNGA